ncbi:MAG: alpha/beta hydrolase fold domain-containing protein [Pseudonocardiaceae bacterium]|nr:alpha/beta hydrolase fold domain-containing protein [Pseudonocardiaceae bacterium]
MASTESQALSDMYSNWVSRMAANPDMDLDTMRDLFDGWHRVTREPGAVSYAHVDAGGVPALWAIPEGAVDDRVLLFSHGGGYVGGSSASHRKVAGHLAKAAGVRALVYDYRRVPESPHPGPLEDARRVFDWLVAQGFSAGGIATVGDSAGGALSISLPLSLRDAGTALPSAIVALSPFLDLQATGATLETNAEVDKLASKPMIEQMAGLFLGTEGSPTDPLAAPLHANPAGLPPVYISVGGAEVLLDDSQRFAKKAEAAGVDVTLEVVPEMQHVFHFLAGHAPEADQSVRNIGSWLRKHLLL